MASLLRTVRLLAAAVGLVAWLLAVPAASAQELVVARIHEIQGAAHLSPFSGQDVSGVEGVVTVERSSSFWMQDPTPDTDEATSEGILVFGSGVGALVNVGDQVQRERTGAGVPTRRRGDRQPDHHRDHHPGPKCGRPLQRQPPARPHGGGGGRPGAAVDGDRGRRFGERGDQRGVRPGADGIDFYESLEGMRVQVNQAVVVGPRNGFGEIPVVGDQSALAGVDSVRGGVLVRPNDFNPERIILDDTLVATPVVNVGDGFATPVVGVMDYSFGNFKLNITGPLARVDGGLQREVTRAPRDQELVVGTYNVENLDPGDGGAFARHAELIVDHLRRPTCWRSRRSRTTTAPPTAAVTDASVTWGLLIDGHRGRWRAGLPVPADRPGR